MWEFLLCLVLIDHGISHEIGRFGMSNMLVQSDIERLRS